jgi:SAM-dependent methyltransferase
MKAFAKSLIKNYFPRRLVYGAWNTLSLLKTRRARRAFAAAGPEPGYLGWKELEALQREYTPWADACVDVYKWDPDALRRRGSDRTRQMRRILGGRFAAIRDTFELGCGDGLVSGFLKKAGKRTVAADLGRGFDESAIADGVRFCQMDARHVALRDASVDLTLSFNAFEHFPDPGRCLREMIRVTRPGGYIFLYFNPLYMAPGGLHAYNRIAVPYVQHLFPRPMIEEFITKNALGPIDFPWVNGCTLGDYRRVFAETSDLVERLAYYEILDVSALGLVERFPSCFRSKSASFEDFIVTGIEVLFRKVAR